MLDHEQKIGMIVPNGKHIREAIMGMLHDKGYEYDERQNGRLHIDLKNVSMSLTFQHQVDVIDQVSKGIFAGGYVGSERLAEHYAYLAENGLSPRVVEIGRFRLFPRRLKLAWLVRDNAEDNKKYKTPEDLRDTRVVTGTPTLAAIHLASYFPGEENLPVDIDRTHGGEEGQVYARVAEAALVVVNTKTTMEDYDLRELKAGTVMRRIYVSAIANAQFLRDVGNRKLMEQAMGRLQNGGRSRTGFLMPKLPIFPETVVGSPTKSVISLKQSLNPEIAGVSENGHKPDEVIVEEQQQLPWYRRLNLGRKGSVVSSILPLALLMSFFALPNPSAILKSWHWGTSKEKDIRN